MDKGLKIVIDDALSHFTAIPTEKINITRIGAHPGRVLGSIFITSEWFDLVSCGISRVAFVIPDALLMITQSKLNIDVAVHFNMEKR